jgi:hypothetical protein
MSDMYKEEIEKFEAELQKIPESHKQNVINLFTQNVAGLKKLDEFKKNLSLPIRHKIDTSMLLCRNYRKLKQHLKVEDYVYGLYFKNLSDLKKFARKNRAIIQQIERLKYDDNYTDSPHKESWYQIYYFKNTNIFNYYLQYLPFFKKKDKDDYVPKRFPKNTIPYK